MKIRLIRIRLWKLLAKLVRRSVLLKFKYSFSFSLNFAILLSWAAIHIEVYLAKFGDIKNS
jgi:hypothetical protein